MKNKSISVLIVILSCFISFPETVYANVQNKNTCAEKDIKSFFLKELPQNIIKNEIELFNLINQERNRYLLPPLKRHSLLDRVAKDHSKRMAQEGRLSHDFIDYPPLCERIIETGLYFYNYSENVTFDDQEFDMQ